MIWKYTIITVFLGSFLGSYIASAAETQVILSNKIAPELQTALGWNKATYVTRIRSIHRLGPELKKDEKEAVYKFLESKPDPAKMPILEFDGLKNELVIVLMKQHEYPRELTDKLIKMYHTPELGAVWQDYCIQFLGQWGAYAATAEELKHVRATLLEALEDRHAGIAGTALIAINSLSSKKMFSVPEVKEAAWMLANNEQIPEASRIPALQIAAVMGDQRIVETARKIIGQRNPAMLKMSAMAALGMVGNHEDTELLKAYERSSDIRLRNAAIAAIRTLTGRGMVATEPPATAK